MRLKSMDGGWACGSGVKCYKVSKCKQYGAFCGNTKLWLSCLPRVIESRVCGTVL